MAGNFGGGLLLAEGSSSGRPAKEISSHQPEKGLGVHIVWWLGRRVVAATTQVRLLVWTLSAFVGAKWETAHRQMAYGE